MPAPKIALELIDRFDRNLDAYRSGHYNETQVRLEFIDPFFEALGWDIYNKEGIAEAYKDVVHEDAIKVGAAYKAPDYSFRIGGTRKFFLEAKKPSVDIKDKPSAAFQLRRYAWSAKLPLSILTDFEEFAVYDCRIKPVKTDKSSTARVLYLTYTEYADRWDELYGLFSKNAVLKGEFDRFVASTTRKRGTAEVDDAFLREIEAWRDELARNIAIRNTDLSQREVNFAVGRTIDRIIFLRICEDRGIEEPNRLMALQNGTNIYRRLIDLYHRADEKYNSGLFHFRKERDRPLPPDELTLKLTIDDKVLKDIFKGLYYPESPYEFSVLPADILGQVYEQFLGKVIRLTPAHHAKVEDKPEVKKAGGVYYTPTYIVDYIVDHTVGKLLEGPSGSRTGMTPRQAAKLRILDPACGSGSFLLGAYQLLLDWNRDWYVNNGPEKHRKQLYQIGANEYRLTTAERKRILLNNIYGVDIDPQAVEVTKLSLLLKVLEEESAETINRQLKLLHERALPDLGSNIKCGNSLIGPDFYEGRQISLLDEEERYRINVFDWEAEFPEVFNLKKEINRKGSKGAKDQNGFDAVIGNPPYIRIQSLREHQGREVEYYENKYRAARGKYDIYVLFLEKNISLVKSNGIFGMIIPNKFLASDYGKEIRDLISKSGSVHELLTFRQLQVFEKASIYSCILVWEKRKFSHFYYVEFHSLENVTEDLQGLNSENQNSRFSISYIPQPEEATEWHFSNNPAAQIVLELPRRYGTLKDASERVFQGIITGGDNLFIFEKAHQSSMKTTIYSREFEKEFEIENEILRPFLKGSNIKRYSPFHPNLYILYPYKVSGSRTVYLSETELSDKYPCAWEYLSYAKRKMMSRGSTRMKYPTWYALWNPRDMRKLLSLKILVPTIAYRPSFSFDAEGKYFFLGSGAGGPGAYGVILKSEEESALYALGLLNSKITDIFIKAASSIFRGGYRAYSQQYLWGIPYRPINFFNPTDKAHHDRMVELVERMLALHQQLAAARTEYEQTALQRQIDATDRQIDSLVYELYGLTEGEIGIIEESSNG